MSGSMLYLHGDGLVDLVPHEMHAVQTREGNWIVSAWRDGPPWKFYYSHDQGDSEISLPNGIEIKASLNPRIIVENTAFDLSLTRISLRIEESKSEIKVDYLDIDVDGKKVEGYQVEIPSVPGEELGNVWITPSEPFKSQEIKHQYTCLFWIMASTKDIDHLTPKDKVFTLRTNGKVFQVKLWDKFEEMVDHHNYLQYAGAYILAKEASDVYDRLSVSQQS